MSEELKPCPFCGESASIERYGTNRFSTIISCDWCGCSHESSEVFNHGQEWNTRHNPIIEELEKVLDKYRNYSDLFHEVANLINKHKEGGE